MEHTKEPWEVVIRDDEDLEADINATNADGWYVTLAMNVGIANARRIVACVNACAGTDNATLDRIARMSGQASFFHRIEAAEQQRDKLLDAIESVLNTRNREAKAQMSFENALKNFSDASRESNAYTKAMLESCEAEKEARDAIAKVEGE